MPQTRWSTPVCGSMRRRTARCVVPPVAKLVWPGRAVASPVLSWSMLVWRAQPSSTSSESLRFRPWRPQRTMCDWNGASIGEAVTALPRREVGSGIARLLEEDAVPADAVDLYELLRHAAGDRCVGFVSVAETVLVAAWQKDNRRAACAGVPA